MKTEFVTYEIALALKELGFDKISRFGSEASLYNSEGEHVFYTNYGFMYSGLSGGYISAPLWQQVIDWLREEYNKMITVYSNASGYLWETHDAVGGTQREYSDYSGPNDSGCWDKYEDVREEAILKAIESIKIKNYDKRRNSRR